MSAETVQESRMFTEQAWNAGWEKAQQLGLVEMWEPRMRPMTRRDVEEIVSAVANHDFEELYIDQLLPDYGLDNADMMASLRDHMRASIAVEAIKAGCVMLTLPREVIDHAPIGLPGPGVTRVRLIVPVRCLASVQQPPRDGDEHGGAAQQAMHDNNPSDQGERGERRT